MKSIVKLYALRSHHNNIITRASHNIIIVLCSLRLIPPGNVKDK